MIRFIVNPFCFYDEKYYICLLLKIKSFLKNVKKSQITQ